MSEGENWVTVAEKSALATDSVIGVTVKDLDIAIYDVGGQLFATDNICPHAFGYLHQGWLDSETIECPLHGAVFEIRTGKGLAGPFECDLKTFPLRVVGEAIQVDLGAAETQ